MLIGPAKQTNTLEIAVLAASTWIYIYIYIYVLTSVVRSSELGHVLSFHGGAPWVRDLKETVVLSIEALTSRT